MVFIVEITWILSYTCWFQLFAWFSMIEILYQPFYSNFDKGFIFQSKFVIRMSSIAPLRHHYVQLFFYFLFFTLVGTIQKPIHHVWLWWLDWDCFPIYLSISDGSKTWNQIVWLSFRIYLISWFFEFLPFSTSWTSAYIINVHKQDIHEFNKFINIEQTLA